MRNVPLRDALSSPFTRRAALFGLITDRASSPELTRAILIDPGDPSCVLPDGLKVLTKAVSSRRATLIESAAPIPSTIAQMVADEIDFDGIRRKGHAVIRYAAPDTQIRFGKLVYGGMVLDLNATRPKVNFRHFQYSEIHGHPSLSAQDLQGQAYTACLEEGAVWTESDAIGPHPQDFVTLPSKNGPIVVVAYSNGLKVNDDFIPFFSGRNVTTVMANARDFGSVYVTTIDGKVYRVSDLEGSCRVTKIATLPKPTGVEFLAGDSGLVAAWRQGRTFEAKYLGEA